VAVYHAYRTPASELLGEVQRRLPGVRFLQEAFTSDHRRPVLVRFSEIAPETFYLFDEIAVHTFRDAVIELAARDGGGRLTVSFPLHGEFQAQKQRLERVADKLGRIRVLTVGHVPSSAGDDAAISFHNIAANLLARYSFAINEGVRPLLFICRDGLGFFSVDGYLIEEIADEVELMLRGMVTTLGTFERLETLHQTTQRISRELESYSRRVELAVRRARRRPDLLTPARFNRIVGQVISKMEQLKEIPRQALQFIDKSAHQRSKLHLHSASMLNKFNRGSSE